MPLFVTSADGTRIAYDRIGEGAPLVLVVGSFNSRRSQNRLAEALAPYFSVINYDRRGRGDSGDTAPYSVERELEDLDAIVAAAGSSVTVFGHSSGAVLALKGALRNRAISGLAMYEPPYFLDGSRERPGSDLAERISALVAAGKPGPAVDLFYGECLNMSEEMVARLRDAPFRSKIEAVVHTLPYDAAMVGDLAPPLEALRNLDIPLLHLTSDMPALHPGAQAIAETAPAGRHLALAGQSHEVVPSVVAPVLVEFFLGEDRALAS